MKLFALIFISIITCSCDKNDDLAAPPITKENTFSCKIDGKLFVEKDFFSFPSSNYGIEVTLIKNNRWRIILGNGEIDIYLHLIGIDGPGKYKILKSDSDVTFIDEDDIAMKLIFEENNSFIVYNSHDNTGTINVLEWNGENILIAEFKKLILYNSSNPNQTIILTEGKLNINLATLNKD